MAKKNNATKRVKMTIKKTRAICEMLEANEYSAQEIAKRANVDIIDVYHVLQGTIYPEICEQYCLGNYDPKDKLYIGDRYERDQIIDVCKYIEEAQLSVTEISRKSGVSKQTVNYILKGKAHTNISKFYDFSLYFNKFKKKENKNQNSIMRVSKKNKIPDDTIREICELLEKGDWTISDIARKYEIPYGVIYNIVYRGTHSEISSQYCITGINRKKGNIMHKVISRRLKYKEVQRVCRLLSEVKTIMEIHLDTDISTNIISAIKDRRIYRDISNSYKF